MKVVLTFKQPGVVDFAMEELNPEEAENLKEISRNFIRYGECVDIEIDLETGLAMVLEVK